MVPLFNPHHANVRRLESGPRGQTVGRNFKDEADSDAFNRQPKPIIRNSVQYVNA
jgi:hypothetical protein